MSMHPLHQELNETRRCAHREQDVGDILERLDPAPRPPFFTSSPLDRDLCATELLGQPPSRGAVPQFHVR